MADSAEWFLAWVDNDSVAFDPDVHNVQDIWLLGFTFSQQESGFGTLSVTTKNMISGVNNWALGLLRAGQKRWAWFSWRLNGGEITPLGLFRLVGIPTDVFGPMVTLNFSARPSDFKAQKIALNDTLRVLPYWAAGFIDEQKRENMDIILDTYSAFWYTDPVTHIVSLSDILFGEDGTEVFLIADHSADGLQMVFGDAPITSVDVDAELMWTQRAVGTVPFTLNAGESYTLNADALPKVGASFGDGWKALSANITGGNSNFQTQTYNENYSITINWWDGNKTTHTSNLSSAYIPGHTSPYTNMSFPLIIVPSPGGGVDGPGIVTDYQANTTYSERDESGDPPTLTSHSESIAWTTFFIPKYNTSADYILGYDAKRPFTEHVTFRLTSDVQRIATETDEDEPFRLDGLKTSDLSELIDGVAPIGDPRRRSFVTQDIGNDYIEYLMLLARGILRKKSRAVEISFEPRLTRLNDLKLNRNAQVFDWRIPGGNAIGKIIAFSVILTTPENDGPVDISLECTIGCAIGDGGTVSAVGGEEEYVDDEYIDDDEDYQQYDGAVLTFNDEMGFTPPLFEPNDDGLDFINGIDPAAIFEVPIAIEFPAEDQEETVNGDNSQWQGGFGGGAGAPSGIGGKTWQELRQEVIAHYMQALSESLVGKETVLTFKLKGLTKDFTTDVPITTTECKIPQMINLGAT